MGINDLQLSSELIGVLYPESLVAVTPAIPDQKPSKPVINPQRNKTGYPLLGKNGKSICFLVSFPNDAFMPEGQLRFLERILAACQCNLDDIALINAKQKSVDLEELKEQVHPRILFLWGALPAIIGLESELPDLTVSTRANLSIVRVSQAERMSIDDVEGRELKRSLWLILKKLFNL